MATIKNAKLIIIQQKPLVITPDLLPVIAEKKGWVLTNEFPIIPDKEYVEPTQAEIMQSQLDCITRTYDAWCVEFVKEILQEFGKTKLAEFTGTKAQIEAKEKEVTDDVENKLTQRIVTKVSFK